MKRSVLLVFAAIVVAFFAAVGTEYYEQWQNEKPQISISNSSGPIVIGAILPLSGDTGAVGVPIRNAATLAVKEINEKGGINGRPLQLEVKDSGCDARMAVNATLELIDNWHVPVIFGGGCSSETLAAAPLTERAQVILFSPSATNSEITTAGDYVFRNAPSDINQGRLLAEAAYSQGYKRVGVLSEEKDYTIGIMNVFHTRLKSLGGEAITETYHSETSDVKDQITALQNQKVDALLVVIQSPSKADMIFETLKTVGWSVPLLGNDVVVGADEALRRYAKETEGLIGADFDIDETNERYQEFLRVYEIAFSAPPDFALYAALSYDAMHLIGEAIQEVGANSSSIQQYLTKVVNRVGAAGLLTLDENGDPVSGHVLKIVHGGAVSRLTPGLTSTD